MKFNINLPVKLISSGLNTYTLKIYKNNYNVNLVVCM